MCVSDFTNRPHYFLGPLQSLDFRMFATLYPVNWSCVYQTLLSFDTLGVYLLL